MTAAMQTVCALGISGRALSDFRSGGLGKREAARLRAHIEGCEVCQARLASYEQVAQMLRQQPEPGGHARLWQQVRASITAKARPARSFRGEEVRLPRSRAQQRRVWTSLGSLAAILALSVGFLAVFVTHRGTQPANPPKVYHSGNLTWTALTVPKGFPDVDEITHVDQVTGEHGTASIPLVAKSDGRVAYACQAYKQYVSSPTVWATTNAGASWSVITPSHIPADTGGCRIVVDFNAAKTLVISFYPVSHSGFAPLDQWTTYASFNGGASWSQPAGLQGGNFVYQLQSAPGKMFALLGPGAGHATEGIYVSTDQMQSWSPVDVTLPETAPNPSGIHDMGKSYDWWVNVATGALLDQTYAGHLWYTADDGAHWAKVSYPAGTSSEVGYTPMLFAGPPTTGTNQTICGVFSPTMAAPAVQWNECSVDYGAHWYKLPDVPQGGSFVFLAGDKALGVVLTSGAASDEVVYELSLGDGTNALWEQLGGLPDPGRGYGFVEAPSGNQIVFWAFSDSGQPTTTTNTPPLYYVAVYPSI